MATSEKTQWNKLDENAASPPVKKALAAFYAAKADLESAISKGAKAKGLVPDGKVVRVMEGRGGGVIFAAVDPRSSTQIVGV